MSPVGCKRVLASKPGDLTNLVGPTVDHSARRPLSSAEMIDLDGQQEEDKWRGEREHSGSRRMPSQLPDTPFDIRVPLLAREMLVD
jgi:hypothetical protein